ncbi:MAG TPA: hypothetical protein VF341_10615, partial [Anaeromyxobacteraceae bacterium]
DRIASHPSFSGRQLSTGGDHRPFCLVCHQTTRPAGGVKPWAADFGSFTCLTCHTNNQGGGG